MVIDFGFKEIKVSESILEIVVWACCDSLIESVLCDKVCCSALIAPSIRLTSSLELPGSFGVFFKLVSHIMSRPYTIKIIKESIKRN